MLKSAGLAMEFPWILSVINLKVNLVLGNQMFWCGSTAKLLVREDYAVPGNRSGGKIVSRYVGSCVL